MDWFRVFDALWDLTVSKVQHWAFNSPYINSKNITHVYIHFNTGRKFLIVTQSPGRRNHPIYTELMGRILIRAINMAPLCLSVLFQQLFIFSSLFFQHSFCSADCYSTGGFLLTSTHIGTNTHMNKWAHTLTRPLTNGISTQCQVHAESVLIIKVLLCQINTELWNLGW